MSGALARLAATPLGRYRAMSYVTGTALLVIVAVGIPLQVWAHDPGVATWLGYAHGWVLFPLYLVTIGQLALWASRGPRPEMTGPAWFRRTWWGWVVVGGLVPALAFVMERRVTRAMAPLEPDLARDGSTP